MSYGNILSAFHSFLGAVRKLENGSRALRGVDSFTTRYTIKFYLYDIDKERFEQKKILKFWVWKSHFHGWLIYAIAQSIMYLNVLKWYTETPLNAMKIIIPLFRVCLCVCARTSALECM